MKKWIIFIMILVVVVIWLKMINWKKTEYIWIKVEWSSMYPTLKQWKLYKAMTVNDYSELKNGDIVVFKLYNSKRYFIKRLWIKPNDIFKLNYKNNSLQIIINAKYSLQMKNYKNSSFYKMLKIWSKWKNEGKVNNLQCGVIWDNQNISQDSLDYGFISCERIRYKLLKY